MKPSTCLVLLVSFASVWSQPIEGDSKPTQSVGGKRLRSSLPHAKPAKRAMVIGDYTLSATKTNQDGITMINTAEAAAISSVYATAVTKPLLTFEIMLSGSRKVTKYTADKADASVAMDAIAAGISDAKTTTSAGSDCPVQVAGDGSVATCG